jgi:hypothetical protein
MAIVMYKKKENTYLNNQNLTNLKDCHFYIDSVKSQMRFNYNKLVCPIV